MTTKLETRKSKFNQDLSVNVLTHSFNGAVHEYVLQGTVEDEIKQLQSEVDSLNDAINNGKTSKRYMTSCVYKKHILELLQKL